MSFKKIHSIAFLSCLIGGAFLRLYFIFTRDIFTDEVFYFNIARSSSWLDIIKMNHWIKDHPQLYILFLKLLSLFGQNIIGLRVSNVLIYIFCSYFLYQFFSKFKLYWVALLSTFLFSFRTYFVYINCQLSPYNFALFFTCLSFFTFVKFKNDIKSTGNKAIFCFSMLLSAIFYSDYTSVYFYLTYIPIIIYLWKNNIVKIGPILLILCLNFIFIFPGLIQIKNNLSYFVGLNRASPKIMSLSLFETFQMVANISFFRSEGKIVSAGCFIGLIMCLLFVIFRSRSKKKLRILSGYGLYGLLISFLIQYCLTKSFISVVVERTYWFHYLIMIIGIALIAEYLKKINNKILAVYLLLIIFLMITRFKDNPNYRVSGRVPDQNIQYKTLFTRLKSSTRKFKQLVFIDKNNRYIPLSDYYFKDLCQRRCIRKTTLNETDINNITSSNNSVYILFNEDESEKNIAKKLAKSNLSQYFSIQCERLECRFIQLN